MREQRARAVDIHWIGLLERTKRLDKKRKVRRREGMRTNVQLWRPSSSRSGGQSSSCLGADNAADPPALLNSARIASFFDAQIGSRQSFAFSAITKHC